jgi:hypothetical protein
LINYATNQPYIFSNQPFNSINHHPCAVPYVPGPARYALPSPQPAIATHIAQPVTRNPIYQSGR